jgi:hypothetical protein
MVAHVKIPNLLGHAALTKVPFSDTLMVLRAETGDCSHSSAAYYFRLGCREGEKSPHMEGWKPNS